MVMRGVMVMVREPHAYVVHARAEPAKGPHEPYLSMKDVSISGPRGIMPECRICTGLKRGCARGLPSPVPAHKADIARRSAKCHTRTGGGGVGNNHNLKSAMPSAFR